MAPPPLVRCSFIRFKMVFFVILSKPDIGSSNKPDFSFHHLQPYKRKLFFLSKG